MKLLCLVVLIVEANCFDNSGLGEEKIVGGNYVSIMTVPYQAQAAYIETTICGATIISEYWLLSSAHCFDTPTGMSILTGSSSRSRGERHEIEKTICHRSYNETTKDNDICLIKLTEPINFNESQKAIPLARNAPKEGDKMIISGYGREGENKSSSNMLKMATVPVLDQLTCVSRYGKIPISDNMFCAGIGTTDTCRGDSGGPGVINGVLAGVVCTGLECGSPYYPGIYIRVDKYLSWIAHMTGLGSA